MERDRARPSAETVAADVQDRTCSRSKLAPDQVGDLYVSRVRRDLPKCWWLPLPFRPTSGPDVRVGSVCARQALVQSRQNRLLGFLIWSDAAVFPFRVLSLVAVSAARSSSP